MAKFVVSRHLDACISTIVNAKSEDEAIEKAQAILNSMDDATILESIKPGEEWAVKVKS